MWLHSGAGADEPAVRQRPENARANRDNHDNAGQPQRIAHGDRADDAQKHEHGRHRGPPYSSRHSLGARHYCADGARTEASDSGGGPAHRAQLVVVKRMSWSALRG